MLLNCTDQGDHDGGVIVQYLQGTESKQCQNNKDCKLI